MPSEMDFIIDSETHLIEYMNVFRYVCFYLEYLLGLQEGMAESTYPSSSPYSLACDDLLSCYDKATL